VLATDGEPNACGDGITNDSVAALAKSARNYNGVLTYVIGVEGSNIANLHKVAIAGGTTAAYDITSDISEFSATIAKIRSVALACEFEIPKPPGGKDLDRDLVNFTYTPKGQGTPKVLLRADNLLDCNNAPGWYYDNNMAPTKIILCPASCSTVQADSSAEVSVLFGCKSEVN
ncbi:MAG: VWA domain-containing protein, partial [Minicystis sp.]